MNGLLGGILAITLCAIVMGGAILLLNSLEKPEIAKKCITLCNSHKEIYTNYTKTGYYGSVTVCHCGTVEHILER